MRFRRSERSAGHAATNHFIGWSRFVWPLQVLFARFETPPAPPGLKDGRWVIVANHRSMYDVMIAMVLFRRWKYPVKMLVTGRYFERPAFRRMLGLVGALPLDPGTPLRALRESTALLNQGVPLLVMPEGKLAPRGTAPNDLLPLEPGAAMLAIKGRTGVIVGALWGSDEVWPPDAATPPLRPWRRPTIRVTYDVIPSDHGLNRAALTEKIEASLRRQLTDLSATARAGTH